MSEERQYVTNFVFPNGETFYVKDEDTYTKEEIDNKLVSVMTYKGTKATVAELPNSGNQQGDVWHINEDGSEYAWNGSSWEELGKNNINYVTPEQFGAMGDGVTDDTDALQAAVNAGNIICEYGKTYLISKAIIFNNYIYDFGGCTIKLKREYDAPQVTVGGTSISRVGLAFNGLNGVQVHNLILDCNKAENEHVIINNKQVEIYGAVFANTIGVFYNCTFSNATFKNLVINEGNNLRFYNTTLKNLGTAGNCSDVYVSKTPESTVLFEGLTAIREANSTSTGQVIYANGGNVTLSNVYAENCYILTDSRTGNTTVRNAKVYKAKKLNFIDDNNNRANPANIVYDNVYFYELQRNDGQEGIQIGGVKSLVIKNMYVQIAEGSAFTYALYFQSSYGKNNRNIIIDGLKMDLGTTNASYGIIFSKDDGRGGTTENVLLNNCYFAFDSSTRAYCYKIDGYPKNIRAIDCEFKNFQLWVYKDANSEPDGNEHLLSFNNATPKRAATVDLPTLTSADTGSIIYDTTLNIFKLWNGSAWIDPRPSVPAMATDSNMTDWTSGKTVDAATMKTVVTAAGLKVSTLEDDVLALENAGYQTAAQVQTAINAALAAISSAESEAY